MTDLEKLFQEAAALAEEGRATPADLLGRLRVARAAHRRRRWAAVAVSTAAVVAASVVLVPAMLRDRNDSLVLANESPPTASPSPQPRFTPGVGMVFVAPSPAPRVSRQPGAPCIYRPAPTGDPTPRPYARVGRPVGPPPAEPAPAPAAAILHTNRGDITVQLDPVATCTVNSFTHLVRRAFYDDTPCHRLTTRGIFILQCGDPSGNGTGGPGYVFDNEIPDSTAYPTGTVAMANAGPDANGSQFFLVYKDTQLDPNYTVFGHITDGLDLLREVAAGDSTPPADGKPNRPVQIQSITLQ